MQTVILQIGDSSNLLRCDLASSNAEKSKGLMDKFEIPDNYGMLFDYRGQKQCPCVWMKDTHIPLDIVFVDEQDKVHEVLSGRPLSLDRIVPKKQKNCNFVLEIPHGSSSKYGLESGVSLQILDVDPIMLENIIRIADVCDGLGMNKVAQYLDKLF